MNEPVLSRSQPVSLQFYKRDDATDPNSSFSLIRAEDVTKRCVINKRSNNLEGLDRYICLLLLYKTR